MLNAVEPFMSEDIPKGLRWGPEISDALEHASVGIICLTPENLSAPWILFEAGALSKSRKEYVCTLLLDLGKSEVAPPLGQFQHTSIDKEDVRKLILTLNGVANSAGERALTAEMIETSFETAWPKLENDINSVESNSMASPETSRPAAEIMDEMLELLRSLAREQNRSPSQDHVQALNLLSNEVEKRGDDSALHTHRTSRMAAMLGAELGLPADQVELLKDAAPLHDIGKIAVPDSIMLKPGRLDELEFSTLKRHTVIGAEILSCGTSELMIMASRIARSHHERWDGTGFPDGLIGESIPLEARIFAVVDIFDALTQERPYKHAWPLADSLAEIQRHSGSQFDPRVVEAFMRLPHEELI